MEITRIETLRLAGHPNTLWTRVHTDEGISGLGETFYLPGAVEAVIHDFAAPLLLGQSAFDREKHWRNLFSCANFFGHAGAEMRAISALDIALWDLLGQIAGQPIYNLIGGRCRDSIPVYNTCVNTPLYPDQDGFLHQPAELAKSLVAEGYPQMKVWPWDRFAPQIQAGSVTGPAGWSAMGPVGHSLSPAELNQGL
ncbi:MAG: mandelate racemase/muconate lactonizing enzyme family protein, partial [Verrucomicrobiae bacterium]|nr:mandelate racemase/muconate lactonizing enzyme family protein [Verrucomicrobiae bacterium]